MLGKRKHQYEGRRQKWGGSLQSFTSNDGEDAKKKSIKKAKPNVKKTDFTLTSRLIWDNEASEGGRLKEGGNVISTVVGNLHRQPNVNCRVQTVGGMIGDFSQMKKKWVKEMGFENLEWLNGIKLPAQFCYWLMTKVDPFRKVFVYSKDVEFSLNSNQVHRVLGIPNGPNPVPKEVGGEKMKFIEDIVKEYGVTKSNTTYISMVKVEKKVKGEFREQDDREFKIAFLMLILGRVLCPTTCDRLASELMPAVTVALEATQYDWCSLVLEKLFGSCKDFGEKFYKEGYASGCGGCTYFLAIVYLDRLRRPPVHWNCFPRISAWRPNDLKLAVKADRVVRVDKDGKRKKYDFGETRIYPDIAYNDKEHPLEGGDTCQQTPAKKKLKEAKKEEEKIVVEGEEVLDRDEKEEYVVDVVHKDNEEEVVIQRGKEIASETDVGKEIEQAESQPKKRKIIIDEQRMVLYYEEDSSSNFQGSKKHSKPAMKPFPDINNRYSLCDKFPHPSQNMREKVVSFVLHNGAALKNPSSPTRNTYQWTANAEDDSMLSCCMLSCNGNFATLRSCYTVLCGGLDDQYVRSAAALYTKFWEESYCNSGIRCMIDPTVAMRIIQSHDVEYLFRPYEKKYNGQNALGFYAVFVPVLENKHWWCAAFSPNTGEVWVMDSLTNRGTEDHKILLDKLCDAMDLFFSSFDNNWEKGKIISWPRKDVQLDAQCDSDTCGIRMLIAIKDCSMRLRTPCPLRREIAEERQWLLTEDLMSDFNDAKAEVVKLVLGDKMEGYDVIDDEVELDCGSEKRIENVWELMQRECPDGLVLLDEAKATGMKFICEKDWRWQLSSIAKLVVPPSFSYLRAMCIFRCPKLKGVLPMTCTNKLYLPNLKTIVVTGCEEVEEIFETNKATLSLPLLPKLEKLKLLKLPKIKVIFPMIEQLQLPRLEAIEVKKCEEVEVIFGSSKALLSGPILSLPNLRSLKLLELPKLKIVPNLEESLVACGEEVEEIFESNAAAAPLPIISLPKAKGFLIQKLPKLSSIYRGLLRGSSLVIPPVPTRLCLKLQFWINSLLSSIRGNSLIASETDVGKEIEQAETQPLKRQRIIDEQSLVLYGEEGSSSNSELTSQSVTLYNNSPEYQRIVILTKKLKHLSAVRWDVLTELENAEIQPGKKRREVVQDWLTEVQKIMRKIQTLIEDGQGSTSNSNPTYYIESFIKEVDELIQIGEFPDGLVLLDDRSTRYPLLLDKKPVGINFQQNTGKILGWLRDYEHCIIGVYGISGVGKTTLLKHIHDQLLQDSDHAGDVCWVTVSQNRSVRKLQEDIARAALGSDLQEQDEKKRAGLLYNRLSARGPTILILDDIWEQVSISEVGIPLGKSNCKIILSTRSSDVCRKMGCKGFVIEVEILHEGEACDLFVEKLEHYDKLEEETKKIAWDIAKECGRLPLAIATMACSLTDVVDINEWITALNDLKSARDQVDMIEGVYRVLRYSYERLNDKRVQNCFLSCILYHEDENIKRTTLIDFWIVEGLLDDIESRDAKVSKGHSILCKLENICLLESFLDYDEEKCVKMHDLIRDLAIIITTEHPLFIAKIGRQLKQVPEEEKWSKDLVKVSLSYNNIVEIPSGMAPMTPCLTVLMLNGNPLKVIRDSFFVHMRALTVLDLSVTLIERVPESVSDLENLRGLMLAHCENLVYVPSVAKLTKLRTLDLLGCSKLKEAPRGLGRLKRVEKVSYIPWDVSDVIGFNEVIRSWTSLSHYRFRICDCTLCETFDEWNMFNSSEKVVWIRGGEFGEDKNTCLLPTALELMVIEKCDLKERCLGDVFQTLGEAEATGLKFIHAKDCRGLESITGSSGTQQGSSIVGLGLTELPDLRSIAKLGVPHSFSHLGVMCIFRCPKMKVVLPMTCTNQVHLPNLKSIEVGYCEELEEIFETSKASLSEPLVVLPKLEKLKLCYLPKIKLIFPMAEQLQLPCLDTIEVEKCEELEAIFGSSKALLSGPILSLPSLRVLILLKLPKMKAVFPFSKELHLPNFEESWVACCEEMEEIFEANAPPASLPIISLPKSKGFLIQNLPKLSSIYRGLLLGPSLAIPPKPIRLCPKLKFWEFPGGLTSTEPNLG